ncbi:Kunitz-type protease inhibitor 1 [Larimichthys crocea]|uniref:Uncharacterized protein n=1 Tax=Larimichthys crocea TaxID=215358 RepID=A0ACD3QYZ2_LARCR|nr:Kunitz-type protease inhibitor 1 [Larimichthys crocea]
MTCLLLLHKPTKQPRVQVSPEGSRFVNKDGYRSYIRESVFRTHLQGPQGARESGSIINTELPDQVRLSNLQPGPYQFQLTVTDSKDQSHDTNVRILVLSPEQSTLYCGAPVKVGPCRAAFPRWRYNAATSSCEHFLFGGCKPNNNNFLSEDECVSACSGVTVNQTFARLLDIDVNQRKARCSEPPHTGPCRASHTRWYYDPLDRKCFRFTYGGCDANGNNFNDQKTCSETCDGVTKSDVFFRGVFERFDKLEESDSGNIALAVLLSVAILALLVILTYCFLKARKERSHRPVATGPAHVALSEQDTLVYNSTTKPV